MPINPERHPPVMTDGHLILTTAPDGHITLFAVEDQTTRFVGTFDDVADVWAALDELDAAA